MRRRRVDDDAEGRLVKAELEDDLVVLRVNRHRVAHAAIPEDLFAALAAFPPVFDDVVREHGAQLFDRQRIIAADAGERRDENARLRRHGDAALVRDINGGLSDERRIGQPLRRDEDARDRVYLSRVHEVGALRLEFALHLFGDRLVDDRGVFGGAEHAVVERLAGDDVVDGLLHVRRPLDERRRVARPDAIRRFARAVRRADQSHPARRENHRDVALLHQLLRAFERHRRHPVDATGRSAGAARRLVHHLRDARDALDGRRMRAEHDGAARLQRDQDFVDRRRGGVGRRHDRRDDAERLGDLDDAPVLVARDDADGLHRADEVVDLLRAEEVLLDLVVDDAVAGFFDGEPREGLGLRRRRGGHRIDDRIDLFLAELSELEPGLLGAARERAGFGNGHEIAVGLRSAYGFGHRGGRSPPG